MKNKKLCIGFVSLMLAFVLTACEGNGEKPSKDHAETENKSNENMDMNEGGSDSMKEEMDHSGMHHSSSGDVPEDLKGAESPAYPVGSQAIMHTNHMKGMDGATATITGAFETTVYAVSYTPTTGGEPVENHKWVIHEEIKNAGKTPYKVGDEVVLNADHMKGMDGAAATIDSAEQTTVYMVSYKDTETGKEVKNHKWVTETELSPVE